MSSSPFSFFQLPNQSLVGIRLTKAFFKRNFELTLSERKLLDDASIMQEMEIYASLKPENSNIPSYLGALENYEEIVFILIKTADDAIEKNAKRIGDFIQKHIPYHVVIGIYSMNDLIINLAFKNINQADKNKRTIQQVKQSKTLSLQDKEDQRKLHEALSFKNLDKSNLKTLYSSYSTAIDNWALSEIMGSFIPRPYERTKQAVQAMEKIETYQKEISNLRAQIQETTQMNIRVDLNTSIHQLNNKIDSLKKSLSE